MVGSYAETGYIDLLYRTVAGWQVVDFKTVQIHSDTFRAKLLAGYRQQMIRYKEAVRALLGKDAFLKICFLDDGESIQVVDVS